MEDLLLDIYGNGSWQIVLTILCNTVNFIEMFDAQANVLMVYKPSIIECQTNKTIEWIDSQQIPLVLRNETSYLNISHNADECYGISPEDNGTMYSCKTWQYSNRTMKSNILIEHNLVCAREYLNSWLLTDYWVGMILGIFVCMTTDFFGRKFIFLFLTLFRIVINVALTIDNNIIVIFILLFFRGVCFPSSNVCVTQVVELVPIKKRAIYGHLCFIGWSLGYVCCPLIGFWLRDWRYVKYASLVICSVHPLFFYFFTESPRWLMLNNSEQKAVEILRKIALFNNKNVNHDVLDTKLSQAVTQVKDNATKLNATKESLLKSIMSKHFLIILSLLTLCRMSINYSYFGILTLTKFVSNNLYLNIIFQGLMEVPSTFITYYMCDKIGRTNSTILTFSLSGVCLLTMIFIQEYNVAKLVVGMFGKLCIISSSNISIAYTTEVLPTSLRNSAYLFTSVCSAVVSAVTPFINEYLPNYVVMLCYSLPLIICGLVVKFLMPETRGAPMPETVADLKGFVRGKEHEWAKQKQKDLFISGDALIADR